LRTGKQEWRNAFSNKLRCTLQAAVQWQWRDGRPQRQRETRLRSELHSLRQRIAAVEAERDAACQRLEALQSALTPAASRAETPASASDNTRPLRKRRLPLHLGVTASSAVLLLGALTGATTFLDSPSTAQALGPSAVLANTVRQDGALDPQPALDHSGATSAGQENRSQSLRASIRKLGHRSATPPAHRQWGPPLLLPDPQAGTAVSRGSGFDPEVKQLQTNLLDLGFDLGQASADGLKGPRTEQALNEFRSLYLSAADPQQALGETELAFLIGVYADLARQDAKRFHIDRGVVAAIRLSSVRTGVDFSYLMELAAVESAFNPLAQAVGSSATGLYQFTQDTWLNTVKAHGEKYGLGRYAAQIEYTVDRRGNRRPRLSDREVYQHLLDLRKNPRVSAMMAAESVRDNVSKLSGHFDQQPGRTELYLSHFLGPDGAVSFLKALNENPDSFAADIFPTAAASNASIFHPKTCKPRTVNEVYEMFSQKFDTTRFEHWGVN
jgi:peptidoglycan hydrolase-like protein with peptidoglycan-binding domain